MPTATMTTKGQITVPLEVRLALGLDAGVMVNFVLHDDGACELVPRGSSLTELDGMLSSRGRSVSLDDMDDAIAVGAAETLRP